MVTTLSSREFNRETGTAKRAARRGPVVITDRGEPAFVLLAIEDYRRLSGTPRITELLHLSGAAEIPLELPDMQDTPAEPELD
jgi:prevent-host-death family protein